MPSDGRFIGAQTDFFRIFKSVDNRILDIDGHIDQNRPFPPGIGNVKCLFEDPRYLGRILYQIAVFDKRLHRTGDISLLEHIGADQLTVHLSRNTHKRNTVRKGRGNTGDHIRSPRAGCDGTDAHLSRHPGKPAGRMSRVLLRANQYRLHRGI